MQAREKQPSKVKVNESIILLLFGFNLSFLYYEIDSCEEINNFLFISINSVNNNFIEVIGN